MPPAAGSERNRPLGRLAEPPSATITSAVTITTAPHNTPDLPARRTRSGGGQTSRAPCLPLPHFGCSAAVQPNRRQRTPGPSAASRSSHTGANTAQIGWTSAGGGEPATPRLPSRADGPGGRMFAMHIHVRGAGPMAAARVGWRAETVQRRGRGQLH